MTTTTASAIVQQTDLRLEGQQTSSQTRVTGLPTALGLSLLVACYASAAAAIDGPRVHYGSHSSSAHVLRLGTRADSDLVRELLKLHEELLASQEDFSAQARQVLNSHLWDLYG